PARYWPASTGCSRRMGDGGDLDDDGCGTLAAQAERFGGSRREIDHKAFRIGAAIVDPHRSLAAVTAIGNSYHGAKRQFEAGGGHMLHIEPLAIRGAPADEAPRVNRGVTMRDLPFFRTLGLDGSDGARELDILCVLCVPRLIGGSEIRQR